jgi:hypothetical protein
VCLEEGFTVNQIRESLSILVSNLLRSLCNWEMGEKEDIRVKSTLKMCLTRKGTQALFEVSVTNSNIKYFLGIWEGRYSISAKLIKTNRKLRH